MISQEEQATERPFKPVPIEEAHSVSGQSYDVDFSPESIKVFIWNIKKSEMPTWKEEFLSIGQDKDLFIIQEAYRKDLFNETAAKFTDVRWDMGISFLYTLINNTPTGTMIGSKVRPTEVLIQHSQDLEPVVFTPKAITFAKYAIEKHQKELLVISVHGINFTSFGAFKRQMIQARDYIKKHDGPVLFAGDFNTWTNERTEFLERLVWRLGLKAVEFKNGNRRMVGRFTNNYLDHSFIRGLSVKNAEVLPDASGSDHKPLVLEVSVTR